MKNEKDFVLDKIIDSLRQRLGAKCGKTLQHAASNLNYTSAYSHRHSIRAMLMQYLVITNQSLTLQMSQQCTATNQKNGLHNS